MKVLYVVKCLDGYVIDTVIITCSSYSECESKFDAYLSNEDVELPSEFFVEKFVLSFTREL